jgi:hypothetical protein
VAGAETSFLLGRHSFLCLPRCAYGGHQQHLLTSFFAIPVASFSWGFREGIAVTLVSVALFTAVGLTFAPRGEAFELNRTLIRGVYLFVFGYLFSYWGGYERLLKRGLRLLQEINNLWNPRFGVDHASGSNLDRLLEFYEAISCVVVVRRPTTPATFLMYSASRQKPGQSATQTEITESAAGVLMSRRSRRFFLDAFIDF